jgi:hypothetical protein
MTLGIYSVRQAYLAAVPLLLNQGKQLMNSHLQPVEESLIKRVAFVMGPSSAAQKALNEATERRARGETVTFAKSGTSVVVVASNKLN